MVRGAVNRHIKGCRSRFSAAHLEKGSVYVKTGGAEVIFQKLLISTLFKSGL